MDPPPPPPPFHHSNLRYGNPIHRPNFIPPPFLSPPQLRPIFPPSPPHVAHRIPHHVASQHPSVIERSFRSQEFHPQPKPYPDFRENLPLRIHHDYRERNPSFRDEFRRVSGDGFMDRLPEDLYVRERSANVSDVGRDERYGNVVYRGRELYDGREDEERRWGNGVGSLDNELYSERRWGHGISDRVCDLYNERADDRRMLGDGIRDRGFQSYSKRADDSREHGYSIDDRVYDLDHERRGYVFNDRSSELFSEPDDQKRRVYGVRDDFLLQVENRQVEFPGSHVGLGRFSGRLGMRVDNEDFGRCKKKRKVPKVSALDRIELGKPRRKRGGGYSHQRGSKESRSGSFRGKEKEGFKKFETRLENEKEREQSPIELTISFKSNSLVAKTILASSSPAAGSDLDLTHRDKNGRNINRISGSPLATSSKDMVASDVSTRGLDILSDVPVSEELFKISSVSEKKSTSTDDLDEIATENKPLEDTKMPGFNNDVSGQSRNRSKRKKKRARKQLLHKVSPQATNDCGKITDYDINAPSAAPPLNSSTALPETAGVPDAELALTGGTLSEEVDVEGDFTEFSVSKRNRNSSTTLLSSMPVADNTITENPVHTERSPTSIEVADRVSEIGTGEVAGCAHESSLTNQDTGLRDSTGFGQHADDVDMFAHSCTSPLYSGMDISRTSSQFTSLGCYGVDILRDHHFQDGQVLLESASVKGLKVMVPDEGHDNIGSCRLEKTRNPEIILDQFSPETHQSCLAAETDNLIIVKPEDNTVSALASADVNLKEFSANRADITQVGVNAIGPRSLDAAAVADCLNVNSGTTTNSNFLSIDHEGTSAESKVSSLDNMSKQLCDDEANLSRIMGSVEGSLEAINNVRTCFSIDLSSKVMMKRKAGDAQMNLSGPKIFEHLGTVSSVNGEAVEILVKNSAAAVDFPCEGDSYKEDLRFGAESSFSGLRKKRRVVNARHGPVSPRLHETEAGDREDTHPAAFTATKNCGITDMVGDVFRDKFSGLDMDKILANDNKLDVDDELPSGQNLSSCSDDDIACVASYGDELISSDSDVPSCPSSPDDLLLFPDFCFPENSGASPSQSSNGIICGSDEAFNERPVSADPNTLIGKSLEKASLNNAQTAPKSPLVVPQGASVVQKSNSVIGKSTVNRNHPTSAVPTVFPRYPPSINTSKKFPSAHFTKSRTWSRPGSASVGVTGPKLQPSPLPQSHATKTSTANQSSYIRKGNSLVRKASPSSVIPSPSSVIPSPSHALSSSVYRLDPCIYNLKKSQASNSRADGSTRQGIKHSNTYERPEALPINHSGKLLNSNTCKLRQSLSVTKSFKNSCSSKPLDTLYETKKLCAIAECKNGSGNNSDSGSTLDEGSLQKRITYVKRKSNQLVVAPDFEDTSTSGLCKTQTSLSDGYFKRKKNQIVRASVDNHAMEGDAPVNVNSSRFGSQALPPKSYSKRQSGKGLSKAYRSSKFSFVWRLHNAQSSEKCNDSQRPRKVWSYLFPWKRATYRRNFRLALGSNSLSTNSQKLPLSKKRGAVYTRSKHGYSLKMSKLLSVGGSSLKWSKSIEKNSKKANEEATRAVVAAEKRKKEGKVAVPIASKSRNSVSRKLVLNVKLRPGERIFRIGPDRYKMDPTRRTLQRITAEEPSSSGVLQPEKNVKRSYVPKRLFIGNNEYVRVGNGNQLVRDPKKRTRALASEKVRWSLRTARMRLAKKRKYCQFFTRFGKCNKDDGKCPYIHDPSKIAVCTKFLNGSCSNPDCKLTHKVMPERMEDCSYFLKGSCSNENCPYRHVNVNPDSSVCESFLRGYCADGNECQKKHTYVCRAFEATGICLQASTCKLHHPKKKTEKKPTGEEKIVRGRYFDGGLITADDCESEKLSEKGKDDIAFEEGRYPDYISLDVSYDEVQRTVAL